MWADVQDREEAAFGTRYRTNIVGHAWAFPMVDPQKLTAALKVGAKVAGGRVQIKHVEFYAPGGIPTAWVQRGFKKTDWGMAITWEKVAEGTPVAVLAAAIIAVVITLTIAWVVVAKFTEKELVQLGQDTRDTLNTLFNPGLVIAAVVGIALLAKRR